MILTDNETKVDLLNNEAIATTIIKLLRDRPEQPVTRFRHVRHCAVGPRVDDPCQSGLRSIRTWRVDSGQSGKNRSNQTIILLRGKFMVSAIGGDAAVFIQANGNLGIDR